MDQFTAAAKSIVIHALTGPWGWLYGGIAVASLLALLGVTFYYVEKSEKLEARQLREMKEQTRTA